MTASSDSETVSPETPEGIRHQVKVKYRIYLVIVAVVSLITGGVMGKTLFGNDQVEIRRGTGELLPQLVQETVLISTPSVVDRTLSVYVSGAVNTSQVVTLPQGSLVVDAIEAVGGASPDANLDAINLAALLMDNDHILVPGHAEQGSARVTTNLVNINTATAEELKVLPNIGPARAQQIVTHRENQGPFQSKDDIMQVAGIGPVIFEQLSPFICVDGE